MPCRSGSPDAVRGSVQDVDRRAGAGFDGRRTCTRAGAGAVATSAVAAAIAPQNSKFQIPNSKFSQRLEVRVAPPGSANDRYSPEYAPPPTATMMYCLPSTE